jgi:hypothetical protein
MCLLCEELWMPFELPPEAKARTFVADSPGPISSEPASPPTPCLARRHTPPPRANPQSPDSA